jgi:HTH-type transcriptional regulator / antitoxin HigA
VPNQPANSTQPERCRERRSDRRTDRIAAVWTRSRICALSELLIVADCCSRSYSRQYDEIDATTILGLRVDLKPIRTKRDYYASLKKAEALWDAGSRQADRLEVLVLLIQAYEAKHHPISDPDPITFLLHVMEARDLSRKVLEPYIGSRAWVAEILNRRRLLTLEMIRRLSEGLGTLADVLVRRYPLKEAA